MVNTQIEKVKNHLKENAKTYVVGGICLVAGAAGTYILLNKDVVLIDSMKLVNWKSPHTSNTVIVKLTRMGHPGNIIVCKETGIAFPSQNAAAKAMDLSASDLSRHLNGLCPHVKGHTFEKIKEAT